MSMLRQVVPKLPLAWAEAASAASYVLRLRLGCRIGTDLTVVALHIVPKQQQSRVVDDEGRCVRNRRVRCWQSDENQSTVRATHVHVGTRIVVRRCWAEKADGLG